MALRKEMLVMLSEHERKALTQINVLLVGHCIVLPDDIYYKAGPNQESVFENS